MNIKPLGKRVLIKIFERENKTKSGLILTSNIEGSENYGTILEISLEVEEMNILKKGDKIVFDKDKAMMLKKENEILYISDLENIYAIVGE